MIALLQHVPAQRRRFRVPAGMVARACRNGRFQVTLARFLRADEVTVVALDEQLARACGELREVSGWADVIDASVVILARQGVWPIVTSDAGELKRLHPAAHIIPV